MKATHMDAEDKYKGYRGIVFEEVMSNLNYHDSKHIKLNDICPRALIQARLWNGIPNRKVDFNWEKDCKIYRQKHPNRFEMAIWYQNRLESLSLGRPSFNGTRVRLELVERVSGFSHLQGRAFQITELSLIAYANLLGAEEIRIMQPINESVKKYYISRGYSYVASTGAKHFPDYCVKKL